MMDRPELFVGSDTEPNNLARFDRAVGSQQMFRVLHEVDGEYIHALPGQDRQNCRIDRLLFPTQAAIRAGWDHGPFGVEAKAGGKACGPAICQAMDYRRAGFRTTSGIVVLLKWVFLYPLAKQTGPTASVMAQHKIGSCFFDGGNRLKFYAGGRWIWTPNDNKDRWFGELPTCGDKVGSR